jgi:predicted dehydrogenase
MSQVSAAVVGTGFIGPVHVEALRRAGVGVLGSSPEKSRAAAERLGVEQAYADYDEVVDDGDVQSVQRTRLLLSV